MAKRPFPVDQRLTAIAVAWRNPDQVYIADEALPYTPTDAEFKWMSYGIDQFITVPDTKVGRKSVPNEVEFVGTEVTDSTAPHALDDFVPQQDIDEDNQGVDPLGVATGGVTGLIKMAREVRVAGLVHNNASYLPGQRVTLSGATQWSDFVNSNPLDAILSALDVVPMYRPNVAVFGQSVWTKLRQHPRIVQAVKNTSQGSGVVTRQEFADLLEIQTVLVGNSFLNGAKRGQAVTTARVWGKHAAFYYRDRQAGPQSGMTFGFTAQSQSMFATQIPEPKRGVQGGQIVRAGQIVKEVLAAPALGYYFENAVA
jgi:hypothetical protein